MGNKTLGKRGQGVDKQYLYPPKKGNKKAAARRTPQP
jgi:hypothetical protein